MKNNTKVRLHLSKALFETITRQVLAESKGNMSGGAYTETVKTKSHSPKPMKEMETEVAEEGLDESVLTDPNFIAGIATLVGGASAVAAALIKDLKKAKTPEEKAEVLRSAASSIEQSKGGMNEEDQMEEASVTDPAVAIPALTFLGSAAAVVVGLLKDLKKAKTPEERKQVLQSLASTIERSKGTNEEVSKKKEGLKEYEQHYEIVNGQCRRYNDEGEYTVVSMHYCR